ncbi:hypothetical protein SUGI_0651340 [Cryptomeria japonica]|nr:hypothetical protein SUGI_0651340 [Cryptomeria japonica]
MQKKYLDNDDLARILTISTNRNGSAIWKFIKECRYLITDQLSWKVGNGHKAKFWHDSWNVYESVKSYFVDQNWIDEVERCYGIYMVDYVTENPRGSGICGWKDISANGMTKETHERLVEIMKQRRITINKEEDEIIWCAVQSGEHKVKLGYQIQTIDQEKCEWSASLCWDKLVAPQVEAFLWTTMHGRILTRERLKKYGINGPTRCMLCKADEETTGHLLYGCWFTK